MEEPLNVYLELTQLSKEVPLTNCNYIVVGNGVLGALGIRPVNSINLVVASDTFDSLTDSWDVSTASTGQTKLARGVFEVYKDWNDDGTQKNVNSLLKDAAIISCVPYQPLEKAVKAKQLRGYEKDLNDLARIEDYERVMYALDELVKQATGLAWPKGGSRGGLLIRPYASAAYPFGKILARNVDIEFNDGVFTVDLLLGSDAELYTRTRENVSENPSQHHLLDLRIDKVDWYRNRNLIKSAVYSSMDSLAERLELYL